MSLRIYCTSDDAHFLDISRFIQRDFDIIATPLRFVSDDHALPVQRAFGCVRQGVGPVEEKEEGRWCFASACVVVGG